MEKTHKYKSVMLIDDSDIDNWIVEKLIKETRIAKQILSFTSCINALDFLKDPQKQELIPDLILLDIVMPVMDGFMFLEEFEKLKLPLAPRIFILTASVHPGDKEKAKHYNSVSGLLVKPLSINFLKNI